MHFFGIRFKHAGGCVWIESISCNENSHSCGSSEAFGWKKPLLLYYYRLLLLIIIDNHNDHHWISFFYKIQKVASCGVSYELTCLFAHDIVYSHSRRSRGQKRPQRLGSWMKFKLPFFLKRKNYSTDFKLLYLGFISRFVFMAWLFRRVFELRSQTSGPIQISESFYLAVHVWSR